LRRDEINKKGLNPFFSLSFIRDGRDDDADECDCLSVMGPNTRAFNRVYDLAQQKLRNTFGMELAELPSRAGLDQENNNEEENEARRATGVKKKGLDSSFILL
jgi:hypothetical protein